MHESERRRLMRSRQREWEIIRLPRRHHSCALDQCQQKIPAFHPDRPRI